MRQQHKTTKYRRVNDLKCARQQAKSSMHPCCASLNTEFFVALATYIFVACHMPVAENETCANCKCKSNRTSKAQITYERTHAMYRHTDIHISLPCHTYLYAHTHTQMSTQIFAVSYNCCNDGHCPLRCCNCNCINLNALQQQQK